MDKARNRYQAYCKLHGYLDATCDPCAIPLGQDPEVRR